LEPTLINASDLRLRFREIMEHVKYKGECYLVQTFGQPTAVIMNVETFERLKGWLRSKESSGLAVDRLPGLPGDHEELDDSES
jgi:hypothetical protein